MKDTRSGHNNLLVNIVFACMLLSIMIGVVSLHSSAQEIDTPTPTDAPADTPTATPTDVPTDTPTATPTDTPAPTDTPVPTVTTEPTATPSPSASPVATGSPTNGQGYQGPVSVPGYYIYPTATPEATAIPNATVTIMPSATPEPTTQIALNNTTAAVVNSGNGGNGQLYSEILPLVAATISIIVIVGCVAFYMSGRSRVTEIPKEPSREDLYGMVIGGAYQRTRRPRS